MQRKKLEQGQALVLIVFGMIALVGMTGLAIDGGDAYSDRRNAQNTADTSALAAALAKVRGQDYTSAGLARASSNGYTNDGTNNTVTVNYPPTSGVYANNTAYIQVAITSHVKTFFAPVLGITELTNQVDAVAHVIPGSSSPMFPGQAIVGLDPANCKAVMYQGNANTVLEDTTTGSAPGIFVNSNCVSSAFFNQSGAAQLTAGSLCAVGGITAAPGVLNIPTANVQTGCASVPYPDPTYVYPNPTCGGNAATVYTGGDGKKHMTPGNYSGSFPPSNLDVLDSGIYCIDGDFKLTGSDNISGSDVMFYMESGKLDWAGSSAFNFSAPSSGTFAHLLVYAPYSNGSTVTINGNSNSTFNGTILAPSSYVTINGTSDNSVTGQVIGFDVKLTGTGNTTINYDAGNNYVAPINPDIQLAQ